jgi:hypothetical protein
MAQTELNYSISRTTESAACIDCGGEFTRTKRRGPMNGSRLTRCQHCRETHRVEVRQANNAKRVVTHKQHAGSPVERSVRPKTCPCGAKFMGNPFILICPACALGAMPEPVYVTGHRWRDA